MHLLVVVDQVPPEAIEIIDRRIKAEAHAWWHYVGATWLICDPSRSFEYWNAWLSALAETEDGQLLVVQLQPGTRVNGWLPEAAWEWVQAHLQ